MTSKKSSRGSGFYYRAEWRLSEAYLDLPPAARDLLFSLLSELHYSKNKKNTHRVYTDNGAISFTEIDFKERFGYQSETYIRSRNRLIKNGLIKQTHRGGYGKGDRSRYKLLVLMDLPRSERRWRDFPQKNWVREIPKMKKQSVGVKTRFKAGKSARKLKSTLTKQGLKGQYNPNQSNPRK